MRAVSSLLLLMLTLGCAKEFSLSDVMGALEVSANKFPADGTSTITLTTTISNDASADRREVVFKTTDGAFANGKKEETVKASYIKGQLVATTALTAPMVPGTINLTAEPKQDVQSGDFVRTAVITADPSTLSNIAIILSGFSIKNNFESEITITGTLLNADGHKVSLGTQVQFNLVYDSFNPCTCAKFRAVKAVSDENGQVSAVVGVDSSVSDTELFVAVTELPIAGYYNILKPLYVQP